MAEIDQYHRCRLLFGDKFETLLNAKVLLLGVGGVGSFCLDALYRTGVTNITAVDCDVYDITNQNRQIGSDKVGMVKVDRMKELYPNITPINTTVTLEWIQAHDFSRYDLVIDAIDDMRAKVALANTVTTKLISSTGGAKKMDPTRIQITSIWKTEGDPLAKKFRYELRKSGFKGNLKVVYSNELSNCTELGSFVGVTGSFGLAMASLAVNELLDLKA